MRMTSPWNCQREETAAKNENERKRTSGRKRAKSETTRETKQPKNGRHDTRRETNERTKRAKNKTAREAKRPKHGRDDTKRPKRGENAIAKRWPAAPKGDESSAGLLQTGSS